MQAGPLAVIVHSVGIQSRVAVHAILMCLISNFAEIKTVFVDGGYCVNVVKRTEPHRFVILPKPSETFTIIAMTHLALRRLV
ncbi:MAG: hypothetical protein ACSLE5_06570 [Porticoccaceae bacterium]